ncbi:MAG: hypothetical protein C5B49_06105 [Bdellovibrio sp.]|nr:MAG: hypothetical protein C5B49_06105 [Bdellovibrio sp.]
MSVGGDSQFAAERSGFAGRTPGIGGGEAATGIFTSVERKKWNSANPFRSGAAIILAKSTCPQALNS